MTLETLAKQTDAMIEAAESNNNYLASRQQEYLEPAEQPAGGQALQLLKTAARNLGVKVRTVAAVGGKSDPSFLGRFNPQLGIELRARQSKTGLAATLAHELSHAVDRRDEPDDPIEMLMIILGGRNLLREETVAESSAALVLAGLGVDVTDNAAMYMAGGGAKGADILKYADRSKEVSAAILRATRKAA